MATHCHRIIVSHPGVSPVLFARPRGDASARLLRAPSDRTTDLVETQRTRHPPAKRHRATKGNGAV